MKKRSIVILFVLLIVCIVNVNALDKKEVKLSKCVDGDTARFILKKEEIKVRFLAVDTPESVHPTKKIEAYGKEASEYTCKRLTEASKIYIEYDPDSDKTDKYDRHLVWVYVDDLLLQKELISKGYAEVDYLYGDYLYTEELKKVQEKAKEKKVGIWEIEDTETEEKTKKTTTKKSSNKKTLVDIIIDGLYGILEKILEMVENYINDMI